MPYRLVVITCLGAVLEFLDFSIVILFANELSRAFLPESINTGLLWVFAIYSLGGLSRPIGGVLFSHFGDKIGRKQLFRLSIIMMSAATLCIGLLPPYSSIGIMATVLLAFFRILQGLSIGGELPGAIVFAAEHAAPKYRGLLTAAIIASAILGLVIASSMGIVLHQLLNEDQMRNWGWRIPFIAGSLLGILGYMLRRGITETPLFTELLNREDVAKIPIVELFRCHWQAVLKGIGLTSAAAAMVSLYMLLPTYASRCLDFPKEDTFYFTTTALLLLSILTLFLGWVSDWIGRRWMLIISGTALLVLAFPANDAIINGDLWIFIQLTIIPAAIANGCYISSISELFCTRIRYTGVAVCINIGVCMFGGSVPYIIELFNLSGYTSGPMVLMSLIGFITIISSYMMVSMHQYPFDEEKQ